MIQHSLTSLNINSKYTFLAKA